MKHEIVAPLNIQIIHQGHIGEELFQLDRYAGLSPACTDIAQGLVNRLRFFLRRYVRIVVGSNTSACFLQNFLEVLLVGCCTCLDVFVKRGCLQGKQVVQRVGEKKNGG